MTKFLCLPEETFILLLQYSVVHVDADFAGKTDLDQARADMIVDCLEDLTKPLIKAFGEEDDKKKVDLFVMQNN